MINYKLAIFAYSPVLLLLIITRLKDQFESQREIFKLCKWSLWPAIVVLFIMVSEEEVKSLWHANLIPSLSKYRYSSSSLEVINTLFYCLLLLIVYLLLRYLYKVRIAQAFDLNLKHVPFALKVCGVFAAINILSNYLLDLHFNPQKEVQDFIQSMDRPHLSLFLFSTIVIAPIVEESIFRGLIYAPLHRKVGRYFAIILSSLVWSQVHFESLIASIGTFFIGILLGWLYDRSGSLLTPIILHSFKNSWIIFYLLK